MKLELKRKPQTTGRDLEIGQIFLFGHRYCLKVKLINLHPSSGGGTINCIDTVTGDLLYVGDSNNVTIINGKFVED